MQALSAICHLLPRYLNTSTAFCITSGMSHILSPAVPKNFMWFSNRTSPSFIFSSRSKFTWVKSTNRDASLQHLYQSEHWDYRQLVSEVMPASSEGTRRLLLLAQRRASSGSICSACTTTAMRCQPNLWVFVLCWWAVTSCSQGVLSHCYR